MFAYMCPATDVVAVGSARACADSVEGHAGHMACQGGTGTTTCATFAGAPSFVVCTPAPFQSNRLASMADSERRPITSEGVMHPPLWVLWPLRVWPDAELFFLDGGRVVCCRGTR